MVRLTAAANGDYDAILSWTAEHFGETQALTYAETLDLAIHALAGGPTTAGVRPREDIGAGMFALRAARGNRHGRLGLICRFCEQPREVEVLRILHDSMDLARHLPPSSSE